MGFVLVPPKQTRKVNRIAGNDKINRQKKMHYIKLPTENDIWLENNNLDNLQDEHELRFFNAIFVE